MAGFLRTRTSKPRGFVRINPANPLCRDIAFFWYAPNAATSGTGPAFYDAVTGTTSAAISGQTLVSDPDEGMALSFSGSARSATTLPTAVQTKWDGTAGVENQTTVIARLRLNTKPVSTGCAAIQFDNGSASRGSGIGFNTSGNGVLQTPQPDATDHSQAGTWGWLTVGASHGFTQPGFVVLGQSTGNACATLWLDGKNLGTSSGGASCVSTGPATTVWMGREGQNYDSYFTGEISWAIGFARLLTDAEHAQIARNPWALLRKEFVPLHIFSLPSAGGGSNYNVTITESGSLADTLDALIASANAITESGASADTVADLAVLPSAISESGSASDTVSDNATLPSAISESLSGADTVSQGAGSYNATISENGSAADTTASNATYPSAIAELLSAAETVSNNATLPSAIVEAIAATDFPSNGNIYAVSVTEYGSLQDTVIYVLWNPQSPTAQIWTEQPVGSGVWTPQTVSAAGWTTQ